MSSTKQQDSSLARQDPGMVQWSPVNQLADLRRQMDDLFSRAFGFTPLSSLIPNSMGYQPEVDIYESDDQVVIVAALAGFEPNQIDVQATESSITLRGERGAIYDHKDAKLHRQGNASGSCQFEATYSLPDEVDPNKINATCKNGVLRVECNKSERARHKSVKVNVKG